MAMMTTEEWRVIPGYSDYSASSLGRVRRETSGPHSVSGQVLSQWVGQDGYPSAVLYKDGKRKHLRVHNLVALAFLGERPPKHDVCHNNGTRSDNRVANLRYATRAENNRDKMAHGTHMCGSRHPLAKLDEAKVAQIRKLAKAGMYQKDIAKQLGLTYGTVSEAVRGRTWKHVQ